MNASKERYKKRIDLKDKIIERKVDEIESLKNKVSSLEIDNEKKDDIINSVDSLRVELTEVIDDLREKSKEYDCIIADLRSMRNVMNQEVFKGRWRLIRLLLK